MKNFIDVAVLLILKPRIFKVILTILVTAGPCILYAQPCVPEICNEIDDDCDGLIDEGVQTTYYLDWDGDGAYSYVTILACTAPPGPTWVGADSNPGSCFDYNDYDNTISCHDGGEEVCNGIDDDGNGLIDGEDPGLIGAMYWNPDNDGDGYGDPSTSIYACTQPSGYVPYPNDYLNNDCDDTNPAIHVNCNSIDTDCDGVPDNLDVCPGGDDSVDNNSDNIPDCSQLLSFNDYSPDWHCGVNKIYVCHNDNNPHTICIDANSLLPAHYDHGDMIGPCTSCPEFMIAPGNAGIAVVFGLTIFPNSSDNEVNFQLHGFEDEAAALTLFDYSGKAIWQKTVEEGQHELILDISGSTFVSGVYFVRVSSSGNVLTKRLVISK